MFAKVLVANRGEIAARICRTLRDLGIGSVVVHSTVDADLPFVRLADEAVEIEGVSPALAYRDAGGILEAARRTDAEAVHPGYGFLSENAGFAESVSAAGMTWIGPDPRTIRLLGDKAAARETAASAGVPVAAGGVVEDVERALRLAADIGYPVILKAAAGGGGMALRVVPDAGSTAAAYEAVRGQAERLFGDARLLIEAYLPSARHVEVQVLGLGDGTVAPFPERECSVQRRFQKVLEETPSPAVDPDLRARLTTSARQCMAALGYRNAGTVEYLVHSGGFVFLEVNARLQVEHPVTELVTGVDLVAEQLRVAAGQPPGFDPSQLPRRGHAIELRVNAEDPVKFLPSAGTIARWTVPEGVRVDAGYAAGNAVTPHYDPLLAKVCVWGADRSEAIARAVAAADAFVVEGVRTNLPFLRDVLCDPAFVAGDYDTGIVERLTAARSKA